MPSMDFLTELCCDTIIYLLFQYFYCLDSFFNFNILVHLVLKLKHRYTCDCSIRMTAVLEYIQSTLLWLSRGTVTKYMFEWYGHSSLITALHLSNKLLRRAILTGIYCCLRATSEMPGLQPHPLIMIQLCQTSNSAVSSTSISNYGEVLIRKIQHFSIFNTFPFDIKKEEDKKHKRSTLIRTPKRHIPPVSLLLWHKIMAVYCFVWPLGLWPWSVSEWMSECVSEGVSEWNQNFDFKRLKKRKEIVYLAVYIL